MRIEVRAWMEVDPKHWDPKFTELVARHIHAILDSNADGQVSVQVREDGEVKEHWITNTRA